jgi:type II secretory pathway pseudopilin PulG
MPIGFLRPFVPSCLRASVPSSAAFTLTEMVVVIGIIILLIAAAVPAIRSLTGTRSIDAGFNTLSGLVARAREEAVGLQLVRGVFFYLDPVNNRVEAVIVQQTTPPATPTTPTPVYYLDVVPNRDYVVLPPGIGLETVNSPTTAYQDRYLGFNNPGAVSQNPAPWTATSAANGALYGGVILFDGNGRLISATYGLKLFIINQSGASVPTGMAQLLGVDASQTPTATAQPQNDLIPMPASGQLLSSQFGFVIFDHEAFKAQAYTDGDDVLDPTNVSGGYGSPNSSPPSEADEENWLDKSSTPILINRYNGTLIRAE